MGLLDDAIREHLELKRRRGADPSDIERAEREALGPVRRFGEAADEVPVGAPEELLAEHAHPVQYDEPAWSEPHVVEEERVPEPSAGPPEHFLEQEPEEAWSEPAPPTPAAAMPHSTEHLGEATQEYQVEFEEETHEHGREEKNKEGHDVLEETPEFLQDAPEHDRLWFEQRPPRDFDFEG